MCHERACAAVAFDVLAGQFTGVSKRVVTPIAEKRGASSFMAHRRRNLWECRRHACEHAGTSRPPPSVSPLSIAGAIIRYRLLRRRRDRAGNRRHRHLVGLEDGAVRRLPARSGCTSAGGASTPRRVRRSPPTTRPRGRCSPRCNRRRPTTSTAPWHRAGAGFAEWRAMTGAARGRILNDAARLLLARNAELAAVGSERHRQADRRGDHGRRVVGRRLHRVLRRCRRHDPRRVRRPRRLVGAARGREPLGVCAGIGAWIYAADRLLEVGASAGVRQHDGVQAGGADATDGRWSWPPHTPRRACRTACSTWSTATPASDGRCPSTPASPRSRSPARWAPVAA